MVASSVAGSSCWWNIRAIRSKCVDRVEGTRQVECERPNQRRDLRKTVEKTQPTKRESRRSGPKLMSKYASENDFGKLIEERRLQFYGTGISIGCHASYLRKKGRAECRVWSGTSWERILVVAMVHTGCEGFFWMAMVQGGCSGFGEAAVLQCA